jgi:glutaminyl-peptide cyclotransferase
LKSRFFSVVPCGDSRLQRSFPAVETAGYYETSRLKRDWGAEEIKPMHTSTAFLGLLLFLLTAPYQVGKKNSTTPTPVYTFKVIHAFPHDPNAYTQGLAYRDGFLYEGTGLYGRSSLRKVRLETGEVVQRVSLAPEYFGEGITLIKSEIVQLTWKAGVGFVYSASDFSLLRKFNYEGEGWGLTTNGSELFLSDGSDEIRVLDASTFKEKRRIKAHDGETPIPQLNELEWVEGEIIANVWHSDRIARISPRSGKVTGWIDLSGLLSPIYRRDTEAVLNGIAYDAVTKRLFVTGKLWPSVFEIEVEKAPAADKSR